MFSRARRERIERVILTVAIVSFLVHLAAILLVSSGVVATDLPVTLLSNPVSALYTPFSFILVYEVYLLIYYLPQSLSTYINKQYEIILLIIMRRLFKDLANLNISPEWFSVKYDLQFTYDIASTLLLFFLIYIFSTHSRMRFGPKADRTELGVGTKTYTRIKNIIASGLVPIVFMMALYSFVTWLLGIFTDAASATASFQDINGIFFKQFFTLLVIIDVVLLLVSFYHTDKFHVVMRNSGFVISTILIRLSFNVDGLMNNILVVTAVLFGLCILLIYNRYERRDAQLI
ncbi:MAG: hypothetical protein FJ211_09360 [Ignavibacteria bacterium]|nr:hypothetical protein [Ignavibacteria bacterium]